MYPIFLFLFIPAISYLKNQMREVLIMHSKNNMKNLKEKIEYLRGCLIHLISHNNLTDDSVVNCSQRLDKLLTEYEKCKKSIPLKMLHKYNN